MVLPEHRIDGSERGSSHQLSEKRKASNSAVAFGYFYPVLHSLSFFDNIVYR
jgi:hypothetical protein